jgi:ADP-ribose pyrophosphatase YjhB (NUDIX family)
MTPKKSYFMSERCWREVLKKMPIPCVDTIVWKRNTFLMGWRTIQPYKNVWALLGGRISRGESFSETVIRQCRESGLTVRKPYFLGVCPVKFSSRHDITICMAAQWKSGNPTSTNELSRYMWFEADEIDEIKPIGGNYRKMLRDWWKRTGSEMKKDL